MDWQRHTHHHSSPMCFLCLLFFFSVFQIQSSVFSLFSVSLLLLLFTSFLQSCLKQNFQSVLISEMNYFLHCYNFSCSFFFLMCYSLTQHFLFDFLIYHKVYKYKISELLEKISCCIYILVTRLPKSS